MQASVLFSGIIEPALGKKLLIDESCSKNKKQSLAYQEKYYLYTEELLPSFNEAVAKKLAPGQFVVFSKEARQAIYNNVKNLSLD